MRKRLLKAGLMLGQRLRCHPTIKPTLGENLVCLVYGLLRHHRYPT